MIAVKQFNGKWRIEINETWEFETVQELLQIIQQLIEYKHAFGQIFKNYIKKEK